MKGDLVQFGVGYVLVEGDGGKIVQRKPYVRSDGTIARHIRDHVLDIYLRDTDRAYVQVDGRYEPVRPDPGARRVNAQQALLDWYASRAPADEV